MLKSLASSMQRRSLYSIRCFSSKPERTGIYAGSFDPPSSGHLDIIERASKLCDKLYIGIATNSAKK